MILNAKSLLVQSKKRYTKYKDPEFTENLSNSFYVKVYSVLRRKIRLIENNVKCRYLKKLTCKGTLRQVFYLSEAPPLLRPHSPPHR
jgi:hypothetical protein